MVLQMAEAQVSQTWKPDFPLLWNFKKHNRKLDASPKMMINTAFQKIDPHSHSNMKNLKQDDSIGGKGKHAQAPKSDSPELQAGITLKVTSPVGGRSEHPAGGSEGNA